MSLSADLSFRLGFGPIFFFFGKGTCVPPDGLLLNIVQGHQSSSRGVEVAGPPSTSMAGDLSLIATSNRLHIMLLQVMYFSSEMQCNVVLIH